MYQNNNYVIFYCDECDQLASAITLFSQLHPSTEVKTLSEVGTLLLQVKEKLPILILVYLTRNDERYISVVKEIRKTVVGSAIPVVVYNVLPDEKELEDVFRRIGR